MTDKFWLEAESSMAELLHIFCTFCLWFISEDMSDSRELLEENLGRFSDYNDKSFIIVICY